MRESKLVVKVNEFFKRLDDFLVIKIMGYLIDGKPVSKYVSADNKIVYGKF
jgi:hypothetical protein